MNNGANGTEFYSKLFLPATRILAHARVYFVTPNAIPLNAYLLGSWWPIFYARLHYSLLSLLCLCINGTASTTGMSQFCFHVTLVASRFIYIFHILSDVLMTIVSAKSVALCLLAQETIFSPTKVLLNTRCGKLWTSLSKCGTIGNSLAVPCKVYLQPLVVSSSGSRNVPLKLHSFLFTFPSFRLSSCTIKLNR